MLKEKNENMMLKEKIENMMLKKSEQQEAQNTKEVINVKDAVHCEMNRTKLPH